MSLLTTKDAEIGGHFFTVRMLPVREARKVYARIQKYLLVWGDDSARKLGCIMIAGMKNLMGPEDLDYLCEVFGKETTVQVGDRVVHLNVAVGKDGTKSSPGQDELFAGNFDLMLEWLDFCVEANYAGLIEKLRGVLDSASSEGTPKAQPTE